MSPNDHPILKDKILGLIGKSLDETFLDDGTDSFVEVHGDQIYFHLDNGETARFRVSLTYIGD